MRARIITFVAFVLAIGALATSSAALVTTAVTQAPRIDGKWDLSATSPHGLISMGLDLVLKGDAITGTLLNFRGEKQPLKGEYKKGTLTLETTSGDEIAFTATLKADGTLAGTLSTAQGDLNWTGIRPKGVR